MEDIEDTVYEQGIQYKKEYEPYIFDLIKYTGDENWKLFQRKILKKYKFKTMPKGIEVSRVYKDLLRNNKIQKNGALESKIATKKSLGQSGVMVVTIATNANAMSCNFRCTYCPEEPGMPKSYLSSEPVLEKAAKVNFDVVKQFYRRGTVLYHTTQCFTKLEILVLGGTWSCYPHDYQEEFVRDIYYAANVFYDMFDNKSVREKMDLEQEKIFNETAECRIISLTFETRCDMITPDEIKRLRHFGCTRVQIGIQHLERDILDGVNRPCYYEDTVRGIKLLKDNGYKIDGHLMIALPNSTPEKDIELFRRMYSDPDLLVDQLKIYPCQIVPYTEIKKMYDDKIYIPYPESEQKQVIKYALEHCLPTIRVNRIIRDFPLSDVTGGMKTGEMRQIVQDELEAQGIFCKDIRAREVKSKVFDVNDVELVTRKYFSSGGLEFFLSHESRDRKTLYSLLRLRVNSIHNECVYPELNNVIFVRELHVFGKMLGVGQDANCETQHRGLGTELLAETERICKEMNYHAIAIISGIGVMQYYMKLGYKKNVGDYMIKYI